MMGFTNTVVHTAAAVPPHTCVSVTRARGGDRSQALMGPAAITRMKKERRMDRRSHLGH